MNNIFNMNILSTLYIKVLIILISLFLKIYAVEFDSLGYYEKFNTAIESYKNKRFKLSEAQFKSILINDKDYIDPAAQLMIAKSQLKQGYTQKSKRTCESLLSSYSQLAYESEGLTLLGDIALVEEEYTKAFQYFISARKISNQSLIHNQIDKRIIRCIGIGINESLMEELLFKEKDPTKRSIINLTRAYHSWISGTSDDLKEDLGAIEIKYLPEEYSVLYHNLFNVDRKKLQKTHTITVILPLSGPYKEKGESYLFGLFEMLKSQENSHQIRFIVFDSKGSGANTLRIAKSTKRKNNTSAILGPLTNEEVFSLSGLDLDIPILVPIPAPEGLPKISDNLYFLSPSKKSLAELNAKMMIKEMGFDKIAVLSPADNEYKEITDHFINVCYQMGVDPVAIEWYLEKPVDISKQLKSIRTSAWDLIEEDEVNLDEENLKIDSLDALFDVDVADFFELPKEEKEVLSKSDSSKIILETIQAIYIPIREEELKYIGTQFPVYNLKTIVFGNDNWLDMKLLNEELIGPHVQLMKIISDINSPMHGVSKERTFENYSSLAYDHANFLKEVLVRSNFKKKKIYKQLKIHPFFQGRFSSISLDGKNKNENFSSQILEYKNKNIKTLGVYDGENYRIRKKDE